MLISHFQEEDGVHEAFASFPKMFPDDICPPVFRIRAVLMENGKYMAVLRLYADRGTILLHDDKNSFGFELERAQVVAIELLLIYLKDQSFSSETTITRNDGVTRKFVPEKSSRLRDM